MPTYSDCGISISDNDKMVDMLKGICKSTYSSNVISGIGDFCSLVEVPGTDQVISSCTDGVGSKLQLADEFKEYDYLESIGFDLVGMVINDLLPCGSTPLFFLDYLAIRSINEMNEKTYLILKGIINACNIAGVALVGGEIAEMPHLFPTPSEYDIGGFGVGIVNKNNIKGKHLVQPWDSVIGISSSGLHSNGYSLVRRILGVTELRKNLNLLYEIMKPTLIYSRLIQNILSPSIHSMAHITGGGVEYNTLRSIPDHLTIMWDLPELPPLFKTIKDLSNNTEEEIRNIFNCGIGFTLITDKLAENYIINSINEYGYKAFKVGTVVNKN